MNCKDGLAEIDLFIWQPLEGTWQRKCLFILVNKSSKSEVGQISTTNILWNQFKYKQSTCEVTLST